MSEQTEKTIKPQKPIFITVALLVALLLWVQAVEPVQAAFISQSPELVAGDSGLSLSKPTDRSKRLLSTRLLSKRLLNKSDDPSIDESTDGPTQAPTERYCDMPILPNVTSTEHFQINYGEIRAPLTIEDFKAALEEAYQLLIVDYGWAEPPLCLDDLRDSRTNLTGKTCVQANPWGKYPVMIQPSIGALGYVTDISPHYTGWLGDNPNTAAVETYAKASCMVLESDYSDEDAGTEIDVLRGTVAHEYVHAIQYGLGDPPLLDEEGEILHTEEDTMWWESHATYIEQEIADEGNTNYYLLYPSMGTFETASGRSFPTCLGHYPENSGFHYTNWPFFQHIAENFGGTNVGDPTNTGSTAGENINQRIFENIAQGQRGLTALENALGGQSVLQTEYHNYAIALALMFYSDEGCGGGYEKPYCLEEGVEMITYEGSTETEWSRPNGRIRNIPGVSNGEIADHYTANYIVLPNSSNTMFDAQLSASTCGNVALRASLVCDSGTGSTITPFPAVINAGQSITLAQQTLAGCKSAYVVVTNEYDSGVEADSCASCGYTLQLQESPATPVPTDTPTVSPTDTATPAPTETSTPTLIPTETATSVPTETPTNVPTETHTPVPTDTPTAIATATLAPTETSTNVPTETHTPVPTDTPMATATLVPTETSTNVPTETLTATPTRVPAEAATDVPTEIPTTISTSTPVPAETPLPTATLVPPTQTLVPIVTNTATAEPPANTSTPVPTHTLLPTNTPIPTATSEPTEEEIIGTEETEYNIYLPLVTR